MKRTPGSVYIGRVGKGESGYFGNPYAVGEKCRRCGVVHNAGGETFPCYELYLNERASLEPEFRRAVEQLRGKFLWCPGGCKRRDEPCHGDVLAAYADGRKRWSFEK